MAFKNRFWLAVALLVAFALRVYLLSAQSLWNDEGTSIALAARSIEAILNGAAQDIHPPLYYFLLHFWMPLAGQTEWATRFLSVIAGTLIVALTFRLAYFFFDEEVALIAAYLSAFSPFQIYYSQETRMYIWAALFAALSAYAMIRMNVRPNPRARATIGTRSLFWLIYIAATTAALYTHYFAATIVLFENAAFAVWLFFAWRDQRPGIAHTIAFWVAAQVLIGLAFAPWYFFAGNQLASWPAISEPFDLPTLLWRVLNVFSVGLSLDDASAFAFAVAFGILFVVGSLPRFMQTQVDQDSDLTLQAILSLLLWALVPVAVMYVVSLSRPAYNPKFLLLATPAFYILAARGLARIYPGIFLRERYPRSRPSPLRYFNFAVAVIASVAFIPSLQNYYFDPRYARDDYRALIRYIDANARERDGILIDAPGQIDVVRYYHRGAQPIFLLPRMRPPDPDATRADVDQMLAQVAGPPADPAGPRGATRGGVPRLYAIYWATDQSDPQKVIEARLAENAFQARDTWYGNVRLAVYGIAPNPRGPLQDVDVKIGNEISLPSYRLDVREARTGDILTLTLNWRADQTPSARYKVFVHLLDANDRVAAQRDAEPMSDLKPTTTWRAAEPIADNYGILIEPGTPPGDYRIELGMYRVDNQTRLPITTRAGQALGDHLILDRVRVSQ